MRLSKIKKELTNAKIDALFVSNPANIFYLTGLSQFIHPGDAFLLITDRKNYLFTNALYSGGVGRQENWEVVLIDMQNSLRDLLKGIVRHEKLLKIGVESQYISLALYSHLSKGLGAKLVSTTGLIETLRMYKDASELASIQKACRLTDKTFERTLHIIKNGITEKELAYRIEMLIRESGGELSFPIIAAFGKNSAVPHHENSDKNLVADDMVVLLDFGARIDSYSSDLTRTFFVKTPTDAVSSTYESLLRIQKETIGIVRKMSLGTPLSQAAKFCEEELSLENLPPLPHSLGHGLGIDIHEGPRVSLNSEDKLGEGIVFTVEPGAYIEGHLGIRIEDTVGVIKGKTEIFTRSDKEKVVISL